MNKADYYNELVILCTFNYKNCSSSNFMLVHSILYSNDVCLTYEAPEKVLYPGLHGSLLIEMYLSEDKSLTIDNSVGASFLVHQRNIVPYYIEQTALTPGYFTKVSISNKNEIKLPKPYNECNDFKSIDDYNTELYKETFNKYKTYKQM